MFVLIRLATKPFLLSNLKPVRFHSFRIRGRSLFMRKMAANSQAYLRMEENSEKFALSFHYDDAESGMNKEVHFQRNLSETVQALCNRISLKLRQPKRKKSKNDKTENLETSSVPVQLLRNGVALDYETPCKDVFSLNADLVLRIGEREFPFIWNAPWIHNIALPKSIMAGFISYPQKLEGLFVDENESEFLWYKCDVGVEDELVGTGLFYTPSTADIGCRLKLTCIPWHKGVKGPSVDTYSINEVEAGPGYCPFEDRHVFTKDHLTGDSLRVVSYNILADLYASSTTGKEELFTFCPPYCLAMDYRKQLLLKELIGYHADLICLQEVDCRIFERDLQRVLAKENLIGTMAKKSGQVGEGVACFYNRSRLQLISNFCRSLGEDSFEEECFKDIWTNVRANDPLCVNLKDRTTVVQVLVLADLEQPKRKFIVANTHLYFHPQADHIRLLQAGMCLRFVEDVVQKLKTKDPESVCSIIFCGDFNSTPECGVYQLFTTGEISTDHSEWISENESVVGLSLRTPFRFESACGTPKFTNYTPGFKGCLDYVFYQTDFLRVNQVLPFPAEEDVSKYTAIPSIVFPSDHIALVADLTWR